MPGRHTHTNTTVSFPGTPGFKFGNLDPVPGHAGQLNFEAVDCDVYEFEGHNAQIVMLGIIYRRRCTIQHTDDVLPPDRLWARYQPLSRDELEDLRRALEVLGLLQHCSPDPPDDYEKERHKYLPPPADISSLERFIELQADIALGTDGKRKDGKKRRTRGLPA